MDTEIKYASLNDNELFLDPLNPRLGRENTGADLRQDAILA
ncbi:MAG: hypothetical protein RLZZ15_2438, partial [Verrucomicrobiota bacterium]